MHPLAIIAQLVEPTPAPLTEIEVRHLWEVAYLSSHGFRVKYYADVGKFVMVRHG